MAAFKFRTALALTGAILPWALMGQALAQTAPEVSKETTANSDKADGPELVVTGTRLQVSGFQAPTPVTVVGGLVFEQRAAVTVSDVVNELPAFRQTATNTQNQRGNGNGGQNRIDLRGLGSERTLTLVDGRRYAPTNLTGTLDTNVIPTAMVDRIEVVTGGASAAYEIGRAHV